jgi:tRNA-splicing ligase RtcB (3'-phosphate/5'-hydroxy nucleic acid ligase)
MFPLRTILHLTRQAFARVLPKAERPPLYDVSHNPCKLEPQGVEGRPRKLFVHRKEPTRAFGPGTRTCRRRFGGRASRC